MVVGLGGAAPDGHTIGMRMNSPRSCAATIGMRMRGDVVLRIKHERTDFTRQNKTTLFNKMNGLHTNRLHYVTIHQLDLYAHASLEQQLRLSPFSFLSSCI